MVLKKYMKRTIRCMLHIGQNYVLPCRDRRMLSWTFQSDFESETKKSQATKNYFAVPVENNGLIRVLPFCHDEPCLSLG